MVFFIGTQSIVKVRTLVKGVKLPLFPPDDRGNPVAASDLGEMREGRKLGWLPWASCTIHAQIAPLPALKNHRKSCRRKDGTRKPENTFELLQSASDSAPEDSTDTLRIICLFSLPQYLLLRAPSFPGIFDRWICVSSACGCRSERRGCKSSILQAPRKHLLPMSAAKHFVRKGEPIRETNPWTFNEWLCRPDLVAADKLLMVRATMPPGHCHPFHCHPYREEIIHVVSGRAEQWVGEEYRILGPGEIAHLPVGTVHATFNPFEETLVFLAILSPAILPVEESAAEDPQDVSGEEPWRSLRVGMVQCRTLRD